MTNKLSDFQQELLSAITIWAKWKITNYEFELHDETNPISIDQQQKTWDYMFKLILQINQ